MKNSLQALTLTIPLMGINMLNGACGALEKADQTPTSQTSAVTTDDSLQDSGSIEFSGYVLNAFAVSVDGEEYLDLEDFYTKELDRLPAKAAEAGFDASYTVSLEAEIGFKDLWLNMDVYVSPVAKHGYQGSSRVNEDGKFAVSLPGDAVDETYRVRANKRIRVLATRGDEVKRFCYNFSAMEKSVPFSDGGKPIILSEFNTSITAYDCVETKSSGLEIPVRDSGLEESSSSIVE